LKRIDLAGLYGLAWEKHDETLLRTIFHPQAEYFEKPFARSLKGIEEIVKYWRRNSAQQRNVKFTVLRRIDLKMATIVEWHCEFDRVDLGKHLVLQGVFWADVENDRIKRFVEYFARQDSQIADD